MEKVAAEDNEKENVHYLPHQAVIRRDRETTKLRIVYVGSAKPPKRTHSLNDCLETGPNYTPQLFDTLVNFRWHKIGLTADIEKAFLIVGINETDRDMLRFLCLKDPDDLNSEIVHLRFTCLVFGLRPSPAILASTIRHHLDSQVSEEFKPHFIELLKKSLYVDDLVTGEGDEAKALELCSKSKSLTHGEDLISENGKRIQRLCKRHKTAQIQLLNVEARRPLPKKTNRTQRLRKDLQLRLAVPPKTQSSKYWAQFGTLTPTSLHLIW